MQKAHQPILITPLPIVIDVTALQSEKAFSSIHFTLLGMTIDLRDLHLSNARSPIDITPVPIFNDVSFMQ